MRTRLRSIPALALVFAIAPAAARAEDPGGDRRRAAAAFDEGVARYKRAEFAEAARAFLEADRLSPSPVAVVNALGAAKRAGDHLLVARTAEKAIARGDAVVEARAALAEAATRLARLELGCEASPCALALDGEAVTAGAPPPSPAISYALPGTHRIEARGPAGTLAEERVVCAAGATYRLVLHPVEPGHEEGSRTPPGGGVGAERRGLPPGVFIAGVGATAVLAGVTVWSGLDALAAKRALPAAPLQPQEDDVLARARRTDYLLLGAGVAGVASTVIGAWLTDFRGRPPVAAAVSPLPGGAAIAAEGRF